MYKHDAIVRAWLDGKTIQSANGDQGPWTTLPDYKDTPVVPTFDTRASYRIKPETIKVRLYAYTYSPKEFYSVSSSSPLWEELHRLANVKFLTPEIDTGVTL